MKKCPACNRTYSDETLSFCLEDGALLSASFNLYEEQETVVRPNSADFQPTQFYSPPAAHSEVPTIVSAKNAVPLYEQPPKAKKNKNPVILFWLCAGFVVAAIYTMSVVPLLVGSIIALIYIFAWILIKRIIK